MDEKKRKELEELRKQINPEILKRVAESMGADPSAAIAAGGGGGGGGGAAGDTAEGTKAPPKRPAGGGGGGGRSGSLSDLKARIKRREKEIDQEEEQQKETTKQVQFLVYDPSHFRAKQLAAFMQRAGFHDVIICSEPQDFVKQVINSVNDALVQNTAMAAFEDYYAGLKALMETEAMQQVAQKLPRLKEAPIFIVQEASKAESTDESDNPLVLSMRQNPEMVSSRVRNVVGLPPK